MNVASPLLPNLNPYKLGLSKGILQVAAPGAFVLLPWNVGGFPGCPGVGVALGVAVSVTVGVTQGVENTTVCIFSISTITCCPQGIVGVGVGSFSRQFPSK